MGSNQIISISDLVANAFIALNQNEKSELVVNKLSFLFIYEYGEKLCELYKEKYHGTSAWTSWSRDERMHFLWEYSNMFEEVEEYNESEGRTRHYVILKNATVNDLIKKFHTYIDHDFLMVCLESYDMLRKMYQESPEKDNQIKFELINVDAKEMAANLFIEINSMGREKTVRKLPVSMIDEYTKNFVDTFNRKYFSLNKKIIYRNNIDEIEHVDAIHPDAEGAYFYRNDNKIILDSDVSLGDLVKHYRRHNSQTFIREIRSDSLKINDMYDEYLFNKNAAKKEKTLEV